MSSNNNTRITRRTTARKQAGPAEAAGSALSTSTSARGQTGSGLKLQLRCIQSALHPAAATSSSRRTAGSAGFARSASAGPSAGQKRSVEQIYDDDDDTDSDIEIYASVRLQKKTARLQAKRKSTAAGPSGSGSKKQKPNPVSRADVEQSSGDEEESIFLVQSDLKRTGRILDINNPKHAELLANATKVGNDYYDSDAEEPADKGKGKAKAKTASQPRLFRNVVWGSAASDYSNDADFPTRPTFTQFVPGRYELLPDGTVDDQKRKLIIKFTDKNGRKRIFANPPPADWSDQKAITALNKRSAQQIRRNTSVRFREVVQAYLPAERRWILNHLDSGKPTNGWKQFVEDFNAHFQGRVLPGATDPRPARSHASLTKEVERFGADYYSKGLVPVVTQPGKARK